MPMNPRKGEDQSSFMGLTAERVRELLRYDPESGKFFWRVDKGGRFARLGTNAGTRTKRNGWQLCIDRRLYPASRVAWLWMTGEWPSKLVDHADRDPFNNCWSNLRLADFSQNGANARARTDGLKGVTWDNARQKYAARIKISYRTVNLGRFGTREEAHAAYITAAQQHFREFARAA